MEEPKLGGIQLQKNQTEDLTNNRSQFNENNGLLNRNDSQNRANLEAQRKMQQDQQEWRMELQRKEQERFIQLQQQRQEQQERFMQLQIEQQQQRKKQEKDRQADNQLKYWSCVNAMMEKGRSGSEAQSYCRK